jgi:hypothetical protein
LDDDQKKKLEKLKEKQLNFLPKAIIPEFKRIQNSSPVSSSSKEKEMSSMFKGNSIEEKNEQLEESKNEQQVQEEQKVSSEY